MNAVFPDDGLEIVILHQRDDGKSRNSGAKDRASALRRLVLRFFTATLGTETNTFSPMPTGWRAPIEPCPVRRCLDGAVARARGARRALGHRKHRCDREPAGPTVRRFMNRCVTSCSLTSRGAAGRHTAVISARGDDSEAYDDCEAKVLERCLRSRISVS